ncbi:Uncharacterised protein [uncultured archaeon]|nr:Uncharacterised protein [uncultured archaeon]
METEYERIERLLKQNPNTYQFLEKKYGYTPFDYDTDWHGKTANGWVQRKEKSLDKEIKNITNEILDKIFNNIKLLEPEKDKIRAYVLNSAWNFHLSGKKRINEKVSYGNPNLIGEQKRVTILAVIYNLLTNWEKQFYDILKKSSGEDFILLEDGLKEVKSMLKILEEDSALPKAKRKIERILLTKIPNDFFIPKKVDTLFIKSNEVGFDNLFKSDKEKIKKNTILKNQTYDDIIKDIKVYSEIIRTRGKVLSLSIMNELSKKNKSRRGIAGACSYLVATLNYVDGFWIFPIKSISAWAKFYGIDRSVFKQRIEEVKRSKVWVDYVTNLNLLK